MGEWVKGRWGGFVGDWVSACQVHSLSGKSASESIGERVRGVSREIGSLDG